MVAITNGIENKNRVDIPSIKKDSFKIAILFYTIGKDKYSSMGKIEAM